MKKCFAIISLALAAMVSCNKIDELPEEEGSVSPAAEVPEGKVLVSFKADMAAPTPEGDTKTTLETNGTVSWEAGDEIEVWYLDADNAPKHFTVTATSPGSSSDFTGTMDEGDAPTEFWAAYPKDAGELKYEDGAGKFYITVTNTDGTFKGANFMAAYSTSGAKSFAFKNAVGIVKIALPAGGVISHGGTDYTINGLRIRGKSSAIDHKGTVQVVLNSANTAVESFSSEVTGGAANIYVNFGDEVRNSGFVYLPSLPGTLADGFGVRYYAKGGLNIPGILSKDTEVTFTRGHIKPLKDLTSKIVWDYYVSASGTSDGLSADNPMSIEQFVASITLEDKRNDKDVVFMAYGNKLNGATFHFTEGTHSISSAITLPSKNIYAEATYYTITGDGNAILDGGGSSRIFDITAACDRTTITDLTLTKGISSDNGGLVACSAVAPLFKNCIFTGSTTTKNGAAIHVKGGSDICFSGCVFSNNTAANGGSIYVTAGTLKIDNCEFINNVATTNGGAIITSNGPVVYITNSKFIGNQSKTYGAAIHCGKDSSTQTSTLAVNNSLFYGNATTTKVSGGTSPNNYDGGGQISSALYCNILVNNTLISTAEAAIRSVFRTGTTVENASLMLNNILTNEKTPGNYFSFNTVNASYYVRSGGYNQYSGYNTISGHTGHYDFSETDNQVLTTLPSSFDYVEPTSENGYTLSWAPSSVAKSNMPSQETLEALLNNDAYLGTAGTVVKGAASKFLTWIKGIEYANGNAWEVDLYGTKRSDSAYWPGCYQN